MRRLLSTLLTRVRRLHNKPTLKELPLGQTTLSQRVSKSVTAPSMNIEIGDSLVELKPKRFSKQNREWRRTSRGSRDDIELAPPTSIRVLTWNIDFMANNERARMDRAISYIQHDIFNCEEGQSPEPCCILLQEVLNDAFPSLLGNSWIQKNFFMVPISPDDFPDRRYGVVTLVSRSVPVSNAQSLIFGNSRMGRNALMVDLKLSLPRNNTESKRSGSRSSDERESSPSPRFVTLRLANTHLESLPFGAQARPVQLAHSAQYLMEGGLHGGIICGDMNIIGESDRDIHTRAGLVDAWDGDEDDETGFTWGYQPLCQYPPGRLDRVFYTPSCEGKVNVARPEIVGIGVRTEKGQWVSDHYGLLTTITILNGAH